MPKGLVRNSVRMQTAARLMAQSIKEGTGLTHKEIMVASGYAPSVKARQTIEKPSFQELLDKYLPEEEVVKAHARILGESDNPSAVMKGAELGYRLRQRLIDPKSTSQTSNFNFIAVGWDKKSLPPSDNVQDVEKL